MIVLKCRVQSSPPLIGGARIPFKRDRRSPGSSAEAERVDQTAQRPPSPARSGWDDGERVRLEPTDKLGAAHVERRFAGYVHNFSEPGSAAV